MYTLTETIYIVIYIGIFHTQTIMHFLSFIFHILTPLYLVFFDFSVESQYCKSPFIFFVFIQFDIVFMIRKDLAESAKTYSPIAWFADRILKCTAYIFLFF